MSSARPPGDEAFQEVGVRHSTGMASSHQLLGSLPAVGSISCLRTRNSPTCPFVTTVTQGPGGTQASRNTSCPLPSRKKGRGGQDSVAPGTDAAPGAGILANLGQREAGTLLSRVLEDSVPGNLYHGRPGPCLCARVHHTSVCLAAGTWASLGTGPPVPAQRVLSGSW